MTVEPGWYHADGDPQGTVRRWNGSEWIGFPTMPQTAEGDTAGRTPSVASFSPVAGQVSLKAIAVVVQLSLLAVAAVNILMAISLIQIAPYASDSIAGGTDLIESVPDGLASRFALSSLGSAIMTLVTAIVFVIWFFLAYRNISLWHKTRRSLLWAVLAWIVPFINLVRPMTMMLEIVENSGERSRNENPSPTPVIAWWFLWVFAQFGLVFFVAGSGDADELASNVLVANGVGAALGVIAAGFAIYVVQGVTDAQEGRRRPTAAQREQMRLDAETAAFQANVSKGIAPG